MRRRREKWRALVSEPPQNDVAVEESTNHTMTGAAAKSLRILSHRPFQPFRNQSLHQVLGQVHIFLTVF